MSRFSPLTNDNLTEVLSYVEYVPHVALRKQPSRVDPLATSQLVVSENPDLLASQAESVRHRLEAIVLRHQQYFVFRVQISIR